MTASGRAVIVLNAIVTVAAVGMAYRTVTRADDSERLVIQSHRILMATEETMRPLVDAESWERAYLLTNSPDDLAAYNRARDSVDAPMDHLAMVLNEEGQAAVADRLRAQIAAALAAFERRVELARTGKPFDGAERTVARANIETVRTSMSTIRQAENSVLSARLRDDARAGGWVNWLALIMTGLATALWTPLILELLFFLRLEFRRKT